MSELKARLELVQAWLEKAETDYRAAETLNRDQSSFSHLVLFLCQQSAEKNLKAYLQWSDIRPPKTHDLVFLLNSCLELNPSFAELEEACMGLTGLAVDPRYPLEDTEQVLLSPDAALEYAAHIHDCVIQLLPEEATLF